jgi:threonine aldolase
MIDLRSDTVTRPTAAMRAAMASAEVGDDVLGDDPTVRRLEAEVAAITGKQAALFVPSGTMGNQLAIATQTKPGDDVVVGEHAHLVGHEGGAGAALSGVQFTVAGRGGLFTAKELDEAVSPPSDWAPRTSLVAIENTHNRAGGRVWPLVSSRAIALRAHALGLRAHLDGARIWNASVAAGIDVAALCEPFDTVSVCFSKGLGAPAGSAFCGLPELIREARRLRRRWGGAMRQAGILAAACLHALAHHRKRLTEDHENAATLARSLDGAPGIALDVAAVETNLVNVTIEVPAAAVVAHAKAQGLLILASGPNALRMVTHLDISAGDVVTASRIVRDAVAAALLSRSLGGSDAGR